MVLSGVLGIGAPEFVAEVPKPINPGRVMYIGLRALLEPLDDLRERSGISLPNLSAEQVEQDSGALINWLQSIGAAHVAVHFDLDVLDPPDFNSAVGHDPNGLRAAAAIRLLPDVSAVVDTVGLGITEYNRVMRCCSPTCCGDCRLRVTAKLTAVQSRLRLLVIVNA
jgi:arginase